MGFPLNVVLALLGSNRFRAFEPWAAPFDADKRRFGGRRTQDPRFCDGQHGGTKPGAHVLQEFPFRYATHGWVLAEDRSGSSAARHHVILSAYLANRMPQNSRCI